MKRVIRLLGVGLLALACLVGLDFVLAERQSPRPQTATHELVRPQAAAVGRALPQLAGYYDTVWPSEHADLWRSHAALSAGLPAGFAPNRLAVSTAALNVPTWGYTRAKNEIFVSGGSPFALGNFTQAIEDGAPVGSLDSLGTIIGELFTSAVPYAAKINPLTMKQALASLSQGWTVNYTGGLLIHQNGYVYAVAQSVLYKIDPVTMQIVKALPLPKVGNRLSTQFWTTYNGLQVLASGELVLKGFHLTSNADIPGYLLLIDPDELRVDVQQQAYVSSARLMIQQLADGTTYLYHVNAVESLRYVITNSGFALDTAWTREYRTTRDGSTQGSSPMLFGARGQVVFADNTAPGATTPLQLYTQPVNLDELPETLSGQPAFSRSLPSFNFFMVGGDPFETQTIVYYDPINKLVSAHRVGAGGALEPLWERDAYRVSASPAIVPDRDLLYIDDYRDGKDHLVVLALATGKELADVELAAARPTIGTIFPGMNDDVYILSSETGSANGLISRVYVR